MKYKSFVKATARVLPPALFLAVFLGACTTASEDGTAGPARNGGGQTFTAAVWNVQALFDGEETGTEYDDYRPSKGWTQEKYTARILSISQAVETMRETGVPDFIGFVEVENLKVLRDLAGGSLSRYGYRWTSFGNLPETALGVGVLSRHPIIDTRLHSITACGETAPRPMLEVRIESAAKAGAPMVFFICHWKSKVDGEDATEALRRASARILRRRLEELRESEPGTPVIVMGDLNENHDEFYRRNGNRSGAVISALLPDDPRATALAAKEKRRDFMVISGDKPANAAADILYTPWVNDLENGSYYYKNAWETIDHVLLNGALFDEAGWDYRGSQVLARPPFTGPAGYPAPYIPRNGLGLSDHLPLLLFLVHP